MIKKSIKGFVLAVVLTLSVFASAFVGVDMASVYAASSYDYEKHNSEKISRSEMATYTGHSGAIEYKLNGSTVILNAAPKHGENTWSAKVKTGGSFFSPTYTTYEGVFTVGIYSYITVGVDSSAIGESRVATVVTPSGYVEGSGYKVFCDETATLSVPVAGEGNVLSVKFNDVEQKLPTQVNGMHTFSLTNVTSDVTVSVLYTKDTDSTVVFENTDVVKYYVDNTLLEKESMGISAGTTVSIKAVPVSPVQYNISSLSVNGVEYTSVSQNDDEFVISFKTPDTSSTLTVSSSVVATNNTVKMNIPDLNTLADLLLYSNINISYTDENGASKSVDVESLPLFSLNEMSRTSFATSGITNVKYGTDVTVTVAAKDGVNYDLVNFKVGDISSATTGDTQSITFTAGIGQTYVFGFSVINTTSEIKLDSATQDLLKDGTSLSAIIVTVDGVETVLNKDNLTSIKATKNSVVTIEYVLADNYSLDLTGCSIVGVTSTTNEPTNSSSFVAPATKKKITVSVATKYTSNTVALDTTSNTQSLVADGKLEVYVNDELVTNSVIIPRNTLVTVRANMTALTLDELTGITVSDGVNTYSLVDGVVTFTTAEDQTYTVSVTTTATENYVTINENSSVTSVLVNGVEYSGSAIAVDKLTDIVILVSTIDNYRVTDITVTADGSVVDGVYADGMFTFTGFKSTQYNVSITTICTDNTINISNDTISAIRNGHITSLTVNGVEISNSTKSLAVAKDELVTVVVATNDYYLVDTITLDGAVLDGTTFTVSESTTYALAVNLYDASNSIAFEGDETVSVKCNGKNHYFMNSIPMNASVVLTVQAVKGEYLVDCSITGANASVEYVGGKAVITFTAGVEEDYTLNVTSAPIFTAVENNYVINQQDILLMVEDKNEYAKSVVYNGIWNNVFGTTTDIALEDVQFEYLAGRATINLVVAQWDIDIYTSIDQKTIITKMDLCEYYSKYIKETFGVEEILGVKLTPAKIAEYVKDEEAASIIAGLTDFGSQETETIRLVYAGSDRYPATKLTNTVGALDLREDVTLDLRTNISIPFGSYADNSAIIDMLLEGKLGVVSASGEHLYMYNPTLTLSSDMVGLAVGMYNEITVTMPANYYYRKATMTVSVEIIKADISVEMIKSVLNYELVLNGTLNKDYVIDFNPNIVIEDTSIDHIYFSMGLDIVNGELIANVDLANMTSSALVKGLVARAIEAIDNDEEKGLTLVEFVEFADKLSSLLSGEGLNADVSYLDKVKEMLQKVDETIDVRIMLITDGSDITPKNHGVYFVGAVTTDANYNMAMDAGYLVITAEIVEVNFVANSEENNVRKFEYDGLGKSMTAEAYDINKAVVEGTMTYYYLGVQTDATLYASSVAPIHAGAYTVCAVFTNGTEEILPTKVGVGLGAMVIVPSDKAEVSVENAVHTYNGEAVDYKSLVTTNDTDAKLAYITAGITTNGNFSEEGFKAVEGKVNIDFPARFDALLQEYFPEEYATGVNADTLVRLLNSLKADIEENGYEAGFVNSLVDTLSQIPNALTITFNDLDTVCPKSVGVYLLAAVVFDPDYMPKANMGIVVIQPSVSVAEMVWNYTDSNSIITVPAMQKMDMTASIVGDDADQEISYIFFGFNGEGKFTKVTDVASLTEGAWLQLAYVDTEISATMTLVKPIARMFVVVPQSALVTIDDENDNGLLLRKYNGSEHSVTASATTLNGTALNGSNMVITYVGVDCMGNRYNSTVAPTNAGVYTVVATYIEKNNDATAYVGFDVAELVIALADSEELVVSDVTVCYDELAHNVDVEVNSNYEYVYIYVADNTLNIVLPSSWNTSLDYEDITNVIELVKEYVPAEYMTKIESKIQSIMEENNLSEITLNDTLPYNIGEYEITVVAVRENYTPAVTTATLVIKEHTVVVDAAVSATCTTTGLTEGSHCSDCNKVLVSQELVDILPHNAVIDEEVVATCTTTGLTAGSHCPDCGKILVAQEIVDIVPHDVDYHAGKEATCTESGFEAYETCKDCGYTTYTEIAPLGHTVVVDAAVSATCTATGLTEGSHCSACGDILTAQSVVEKAPHSYKHYAAKPATCEEAGHSAYVTCKNCTYNTYNEIPALGHTVVVDEAVSATCTSTGLTEGSHCSTCDKVLVSQKLVDMTEHRTSSWIIVRVPTCQEKGYSHKVCLDCGKELTSRDLPKVSHHLDHHSEKAPTCEEYGHEAYVSCRNCSYNTFSAIAPLGHSAVVDAAVSATCTSTGLTAGSHCSVCDKVLVAQNATNKLAHNYGAWVLDVCVTATTDGRYVRHCSDCNHADYSVISAYGDRDIANIKVSDSDNGKATITEENVTDALKDAKEAGKNEVVVSNNSSETLTNVELNTSSLQQIIDASSSLTIKATNIHATFDNNALSTIMSQANGDHVSFDLKTIATEELTEAQRNTLNDTKVLAVLSAQVVCDNATISNFGEGRVQLRIPFEIEKGKSAANYKIMYIADDGSMEEVATTYVDGELVVELEHFSEYVIVDTSNSSISVSAVMVIVAMLAVYASIAVVGICVVARKQKHMY